MLRFAMLPFHFVRHHAWLSLALSFLVGVAAVGGVNLWAWHHYRAAEEALRVDKMESAREHIDACLRVWRWSSTTHFLAARIERVSGHYPQAEAHLTECVRLQHGASEQTQLEEVLLRAQAGDITEVERGLWECVQKDHPEKARILETLGRVYMRDGRSRAAKRALTLWLELEPEAARGWHWRAWVNERLQSPEEAIPDYEKAIELDPSLWRVRVRLTRLILERNNPGDARTHLDELIRTHADEPDVQIALAQCLQLEGEEEQAVAVLDKLLAAHPDSFEGLALRGRLEAQRQHPAEAEIQLRKALSHRPADLRTLYILYQCLEQQGKDKEAAAVLKRHKATERDVFRLTELWGQRLEKEPNNPDLLSEVGAILLRLGEGEEAVRWLHHALQASHDTHQPSMLLLMRYYESHGDTAQANDYRRVLEKLNGGKPLPAAAASEEG
jgi:tetratricopeptide (TPR) repeat protein